MGTVYVFFADGFEEIEAFTSVDVMRRAGLNVEMVTVTPDEIVTGAHDVPVLCDKNVVNCDFFDAELVLLPAVCRVRPLWRSVENCVIWYCVLPKSRNRLLLFVRLLWYWVSWDC